MRLLIVEDSELVRKFMTELLLGIANVECVYEAGTLHEALEGIRRDQPDMVVLDVHLPDGNAIDVIAEFKKVAPNMLIAMFTGDVTEFTKKRSFYAGADWFFDKFMEFEKVLGVVRELARQERLNDLRC